MFLSNPSKVIEAWNNLRKGNAVKEVKNIFKTALFSYTQLVC